MRSRGRKYFTNIARKLGKKPMTEDLSKRYNDGNTGQ